MNRNVCIISFFLVACQEEVPDLSTGKTPIDVTVQTELVDFTDDRIYDNQIIIKRNSTTVRSTKFDLNVLENLPKLGYEVVEAPPGVELIDFIEEMRASGEFDIVEPNIEVSLNPPLEDEDLDSDQENDGVEEQEEQNNDSGRAE